MLVRAPTNAIYNTHNNLKGHILVILNFYRLIYSRFHAQYTDLNECSMDSGGCEHDCVNLVPGFECQCWEGYRLDENGINCTGQCVYSPLTQAVSSPVYT